MADKLGEAAPLFPESVLTLAEEFAAFQVRDHMVSNNSLKRLDKM